MEQAFTYQDSGFVAEAMQAAVQTTLDQLDDEMALRLSEKILELVMTSKPYLWVTAEGLENLIKNVFEDKEFTDFVFMLQFNFMMRWGEGQQKFIALANTVSWALAAFTDANAKGVSELSAIPSELQTRLAARAATATLLQENPWIVCLAILRSYVSKNAFLAEGPARTKALA